MRTLTGDLLFTLRANVSTMWLRRVPVFRGLVRFLGLPISELSSSFLNLAYILPNFGVSLKGDYQIHPLVILNLFQDLYGD